MDHLKIGHKHDHDHAHGSSPCSSVNSSHFSYLSDESRKIAVRNDRISRGEEVTDETDSLNSDPDEADNVKLRSTSQ